MLCNHGTVTMHILEDSLGDKRYPKSNRSSHLRNIRPCVGNIYGGPEGSAMYYALCDNLLYAPCDDFQCVMRNVLCATIKLYCVLPACMVLIDINCQRVLGLVHLCNTRLTLHPSHQNLSFKLFCSSCGEGIFFGVYKIIGSGNDWLGRRMLYSLQDCICTTFRVQANLPCQC